MRGGKQQVKAEIQSFFAQKGRLYHEKESYYDDDGADNGA